MARADDFDTDVLVVGSGPVGLMVAGELARRGVATHIIDRAKQRNPESRALVVHARTLEVLDLAGIGDAFVRQGYPAPGLNLGLDGARQVAINMRVLDSRYPFMLVLPQHETEAILARHLFECGIETVWGTTLASISQSDSAVIATTVRHDGIEENISARYVIGCDGAHSSVRGLADLPFEGKQHSEVVLIGDVDTDTKFLRSRITNFTAKRGFVSILPFLGEKVRVFAVDFAQQDHRRGDELRLEELQATVDAILPFPIKLRDPVWLTRYTAPSRGVRSLRAGRIFLAGDAAHAHSPAGGQGMNTGLQDAANLGWKLAAVLRGYAEPALLDTYDRERRPVHEASRHQADRMFRAFVTRNPLAKATRSMVARTLVPRPSVQRRLAETLSGVGVNYSGGTRIRRRHSLRSGERLPDIQLWTSERAFIRLYEVVRNPTYTMLIYVSADRLSNDRIVVEQLLESIALHTEAVYAGVVLDEGVLDRHDVNADVFVDFTGRFAEHLGASHGSVLLVRPDGYLAEHSKGFDSDLTMQVGSPWLSTPSVK